MDIEHQLHSHRLRQRSKLTSQHIKSLQELRNDADIIIVEPDNVSDVVVMNKSDYKSEKESILND